MFVQGWIEACGRMRDTTRTSRSLTGWRVLGAEILAHKRRGLGARRGCGNGAATRSDSGDGREFFERCARSGVVGLGRSRSGARLVRCGVGILYCKRDISSHGVLYSSGSLSIRD